MEEPIQPTQPIEDKKKIRQCPHCGQNVVIKSSWDALWRKPTMNEWIILFMLIMTLFGAWAYQRDIKICREYVENHMATFNSSQYGSGPPPNQSTYMNTPNLTLVIPTIPDNDSTNDS